jgi:hypothetical protein
MATLRLLLGFAVFGFVALLCYKLVPPVFANYQLEDAIKNDALQATYTAHSEDDIRQVVIKHAHDFDIELEPKDVHVKRTGSYGNGTLTIDAVYTVPVEFPGYAMTIEFHPSSNNKGVF